MRRRSLVRSLQRGAIAVQLVATLAIGAGTASFLHLERRAAVDRALLAAVASGATDDRTIALRRVRPGAVPREDALAAIAGRPVWRTVGDERRLLARVPREAEHEEEEEDEQDEERPLLVVASAPRPTFTRTAGPFLVGFAAVAGLVSAAAAIALRVVLARAVEPLAAASRDVSRVMGAGLGARVAEDGPAEIRTLLASVNALLGRLEDAFRAQGRFTTEAAHELRTPVAALVGELEVALRRPRSLEEGVEALRRALGSARRLSELVEGLLLLARVDAGHTEQGRAREHAGHLAWLAATRERKGIEASGGTLTVRVESDPEVEVHEALWVAAIANLLRNAAVHAPGAPVVLRVAASDATVWFAVEDGGPGIPDDVWRGTSAGRRAGAGLGVGLPLAREIARRHGGDCVIEGRNRVALTLPLATAERAGLAWRGSGTS